jgi:TetR/AcrR family transcriptional regulator, transcriptional repressor for nem operon
MEHPPAARTTRGEITRSRIVAAAADLIRERGVGGTTLDDVARAGKVSKSQLYSHFDDKIALVRAVVDLVGDQTISRERASLGGVTSISELRRWKQGLVDHNALNHGRYGCSLGSLANEVADQDRLAQKKLDELFAAWRELFEDLLRRFQENGTLRRDVDVTPLATGFVAAVQGGYLLAQTARDAASMDAAIEMTIAHLELLAPGRA